ncbi:MAG: NAD(P)-dependent glycerol-3-phosphate dehydrogenase [Puniceicoccales bacterium]|jgi:glycerol-3-phosphate dehydrogenase (NAD(P)+)|nr:NAD(P)-dependent glycerol-3-phosphate dehydrogenase [Puniceicoccales bacterium]
MKIAVVGAGAWGTAVGILCARAKHRVTLITQFAEQAVMLKKLGENAEFLPGVPVPPEIEATADYGALSEQECIFLACPSKALPEVCQQLTGCSLDAESCFVSLCKGLQAERLALPSDVFHSFNFPNPFAVLSGPTHARDVALGHPTAVVVAAESEDMTRHLQRELRWPTVRLYRSQDVRGVELAGCLKNVYAIGAGMNDGLGYGENGKCAYLSCVLQEMTAVGQALGGKKRTFAGFSGLGDLMATCGGAWSRNRQFGEDWVRNQRPPAAAITVEGYVATQSFHLLCQQKQIQAPILESIYEILYKKLPVLTAVERILSRHPSQE